MATEIVAPDICLRNLEAWYGESQILHDVTFDVIAGSIVALLGRNGSGRSTTLKALIGLLPKRRGSILIRGIETIQLRPYAIARLGISYCPEDRGIFSALTCEENLLLPPRLDDAQHIGLDREAIYELFPNLAERRRSLGGALSGGEQQMLAIARILRSGARILLLDEISEGLAPVIVERLSIVLHKLQELKYTILIVEQSYQFVQDVADTFVVMENGRIALAVSAQNLAERKPELLHILGV